MDIMMNNLSGLSVWRQSYTQRVCWISCSQLCSNSSSSRSICNTTASPSVSLPRVPVRYLGIFFTTRRVPG